MIKQNDVFEIANAKINLHLDITGRIDDGFHSVATVMQSVSLCDEVRISDIRESEKVSVEITCDVDTVPTDRRNLAYRAVELFCEAVGVSLNAKIDIRKRIPMFAGMAGGSADAAAVLRGLNRALGEPLTVDGLCAIGSKLGSDVPFCIVGGTAYADGKGDVLHSLSKMPDCTLVMACEGEGVSTPWAYSLVDEAHGGFAPEGDYVARDVVGLCASL